MLTRQHFSLRSIAAAATIAIVTLTSTPFASAQTEKPSSAVADVVKGVVFDPTTYAPAIISYHGTMKDWNTSQVFFQNGYVEHNARFTLTGQPDGIAVSYAAGRNQIFKDAVSAFGISAAQNATSRLVERVIIERYPEHRKIAKTVGWIQRIALASLMSYRLSARHYRQAQANVQLADELGLH
jgi:hypothetical protein